MNAAASRYSARVLELFAELPGAGSMAAGAGEIVVGEAMALDRGAWVRFEARLDGRPNRGMPFSRVGMPAYARGGGSRGDETGVTSAIARRA